jgi:multidrug resistance efflux pump
MSEHHQPEPEFVSHLEWQLRTALKREDRFAEPVRPHRGGTMKAAALIMVSALMGAGGVVASDEIQDAKAQEILVAKVTSDMELAALELEAIRERVDEVARQYEAGVIEEEALMAATLALEEAEVRLATLQLDLEEVQISGKEPQNQVSAPLVDRRDFVTERLVLREAVAGRGRDMARVRLDRIQNLRESGVVGEEEVFRGTLALNEAESHLQSIQGLLGLRQRFLKGDLEGAAAEKELEILETQRRIDLTREALDEAMVRYQRLEERVVAGLIHESELKQARIQLIEMEIELNRLQRTLEILQRIGRLP